MQQLPGLDNTFDANFEALIHIVNELKQSKADTFAPAQFTYIESLLKKAMNQSASVRALLCARIEQVLDTYPEKAPDDALTRTEDALPSPMAALVSSLNEQDRSLDEGFGYTAPNPRQLSFDELLHRQEKAIVAANTSVRQNKDKTPHKPAAFAELKSARLHKELQVKYQLEQLVHLSKEESPENPGPLNPQMLTIKTLTLADDISPAYLKRLVSYIDTLFYLETAGDTLTKQLAKMS